MADSEMVVLSRALIDEFSGVAAGMDVAIRRRVVSRLLAPKDGCFVEDLAATDRDVLRPVPTMWR
jgi:hypothetical protein